MIVSPKTAREFAESLPAGRERDEAFKWVGVAESIKIGFVPTYFEEGVREMILARTATR